MPETAAGDLLKYDKLKKTIADEIRFMQPNSRLPSRHSLCMKYKLSRATVDKALTELIAEGALYSVQGSGTFVANCHSNGTGVISWGVVVPNIMDDICPVFLRGIEDFAQKLSINIVICNTDNDPEKETEYLQRLADSGVRGIIIIPTIIPSGNHMIYKQLEHRNISYVFCNRSIDGMEHIPFVASNDFYGGYCATKHLIEMGYRKIGFVSRYHYRTSMNRFYGYTAALLEAGIDIDRAIVAAELPDFQNRGVKSFLERVLALPSPPDAFFCHNDDVAVSLYRELRESGKSISGDIGVIGYDNTSICETLEPKLTSMAFRNYEMGAKAADILYDLTLGRKFNGFHMFVYQPELVKRGSCLGPSSVSNCVPAAE